MAEVESETPWWLVALICAAGVLVAFQVGKAPAALPALRAELGLSLVTAGWIISIFNLIAALCGALAGIAGDRLGYRRMILLGLLLVSSASLAGAAAEGPALILGTRLLEGVGFILVVAAAPGLIVRLSAPAHRRIALGIWSGYMPTGIALILLLSPTIMAWAGWRGLWIANGVLVAAGCAVFLLATRRLPAGTATAERQPLSGLWRTLSAPGPLALGLCFAAYTFQYISLIGFLPLLLVEQEGLSQAAAVSLTALVVLTNVAGAMGAGWLLERGWRRAWLVVGTSLVMAACAPGIFDADLGNWTRYLLAIAFSAIGGLIPGSLIAGTPLHAPSPGLVGTTNGIVMQGSQFGQMTGPPLLAVLVSQFGGWHVAPGFLVAGAAATLLLGLWIGRLERARA